MPAGFPRLRPGRVRDTRHSLLHISRSLALCSLPSHSSLLTRSPLLASHITPTSLLAAHCTRRAPRASFTTHQLAPPLIHPREEHRAITVRAPIQIRRARVHDIVRVRDRLNPPPRLGTGSAKLERRGEDGRAEARGVVEDEFGVEQISGEGRELGGMAGAAGAGVFVEVLMSARRGG